MKDHKYGHRDRLRKRFLLSGLDGFLNYEILEFILSYVIIQKDCKNIAKNLIYKYGDVYTILKLDINELASNDNITFRIAVFLKLLFELIENGLYQKLYKTKIIINDNKKLLDYLFFSLGKENIEVLKVLFLDTQNQLLRDENIALGTLDRNVVYTRELVKKIFLYHAKSIILVHNHPSGSIQPSQSDIYLTNKLQQLLEELEIQLLDHLIIGKNDYFSFLERGIL